MKSSEMEKLTAYTVTKGSTDETFLNGDIIWKCKNGDVMLANGGGWVEREDIEQSPETNDFEVEKNEEYAVIAFQGAEMLIARKELELH